MLYTTQIRCTGMFVIYFIFTSVPLVSGALQTGLLEGISFRHAEIACASYIAPGAPLATSSELATKYRILDLTRKDGCEIFLRMHFDHMYQVESEVVALSWINCSALEVIKNVQERGGMGVLFAAKLATIQSQLPTAQQMREFNITIPVGVVSKGALRDIMSLGSIVHVKEFAPTPKFYMDYSMIIAWLMAILSIALGACWERCILHPLNQDAKMSYEVPPIGEGKAPHDVIRPVVVKSINGRDDVEQMSLAPAAKLDNPELPKPSGTFLIDASSQTAAEANKKILFSVIKISIGLVVITIMLVLLFFFYQYVIYVVMALFCLIATAGMNWCMGTFGVLIPCCTKRFDVACCKLKPQYRSILIFLFCVGFTITWIIVRNESYGWIFQDILAMFAAIRCVSKLELYNLKVCIVILFLFLGYNAFLVFATPKFTSDGVSILQSLFTPNADGSLKESIPLAIRVPQISLNPLAMCHHRETTIGIIDIVIPGAVVAYCFEFGYQIGSPLGYTLGSLAAYGVGMFLTFLVMILLLKLQPALLYTTPCILITIILIAIVRKELRKFWLGDIKVSEVRNNYNAIPQRESNV